MKDTSKLNTIGWISYGLHLFVALSVVLPAAQVSVLLLIAPLILDLINQESARGTWHETHFRWRIRSMVIAAIWYAVTSPLYLLFYVPGWIAWTIISIWFLYRIVLGMLKMNEQRPMEFSNV